MHLGILAPDLTFKHGWGAYTLHLLDALHQAGVQLTVIAARNTGTLETQLPYPVHQLLPNIEPRERRMLLKQLALVPTVRRLLKNCDLIHVTSEFYAPLGAWIAGGKPLILTGHGSYVQYHTQRRFPVSLLYRRAFSRALTVCVSRYTADTLRRALPDARVTVVNNGVDAARFDSAWAQRANAPNSALILSLGAVKQRKGTLELVRALAVVRQKIPAVQAVIIGALTMEVGYVQQVNQEITALGLSDCVRLIGQLPDDEVQQWMAAADLFVLPSINAGWKFEGFGLAHLEASAAGLPVISTRGSGVEDAVDDGVTGVLVSQEHIADELPAAIMRLLNDPQLARKMGAAGRAKAESQTWAHVAAQMIQVYEQQLQQV